jgi:hypothetical protein
MKVAWVDLTETVASGSRTVWAGSAIPVLAKASGTWLYRLFDLGILATRQSSFVSLNFSWKVSKFAWEKYKKRICTSL